MTTLTDYEHQLMVTALFKKTGFDASHESAMHAAVGVAGEAGELLDAVKKGWAYGKNIDMNNVVEELGDLEFYLEALRQTLGIDRNMTLQRNQQKLAVRYHSGVYSDQHAIERKDKE